MNERRLELDVTKFKPVKGSRLNQEQAERYGEHLLMLEEEYGGLTPELVVGKAESPESPLHDFFEWNDGQAARMYREEQARYMMRSITVTVESNADEPIEVRIFHHINMEKKGPVYVGLGTILADEENKRQVIEQALRELDAWEKKYRIYSELFPVLKAIKSYLEREG